MQFLGNIFFSQGSFRPNFYNIVCLYFWPKYHFWRKIFWPKKSFLRTKKYCCATKRSVPGTLNSSLKTNFEPYFEHPRRPLFDEKIWPKNNFFGKRIFAQKILFGRTNLWPNLELRRIWKQNLKKYLIKGDCIFRIFIISRNYKLISQNRHY